MSPTSLPLPVFAHRWGRWVTARYPRLPGMWRLRQWLMNHQRLRFPCESLELALPSGPRMAVNPNDLIGRTIFYCGLWEAPVARHFVSQLREGDTALDVGANLGQFTLLASQAVGPAGRVVAVEASPAMADRLRNNVRLNAAANVQVLELAAWDRSETLWLDAGEPGNCGMARVAAGKQQDHLTPVRAARLDEALPEAGITAIDVMKIDIEGAELNALAGLSGLIERAPPRAIYCEIATLSEQDVKQQSRVVAHFSERGYRGWIVDDRGERPLGDSFRSPGFLETVAFLRS